MSVGDRLTVQDVVFMRAVVMSEGLATARESQDLTLVDLEELYDEVLREAAAEEVA